MASTYDYDWDQGADLTISIVYKEGPEGATVPVNLSAYKFRMDIIAPSGKVLVVTNDEALTDTDPFTAGAQADSTFEVTMDASGNITVTLSRALTLPGGAFYDWINANPSQNVFTYDMFLRTAANIQTKILEGTITIHKSLTLWV
jgi:hypothetical protein